MRQFEPGSLIGGEFKVVRVFGGSGVSGMGVVYLVENRELCRPIVLKTFQIGSYQKLVPGSMQEHTRT
jgi:hypothetical protein